MDPIHQTILCNTTPPSHTHLCNKRLASVLFGGRGQIVGLLSVDIMRQHKGVGAAAEVSRACSGSVRPSLSGTAMVPSVLVGAPKARLISPKTRRQVVGSARTRIAAVAYVGGKGREEGV